MNSGDPATPTSALLRAASIANTNTGRLLSNLTTVAGGLVAPVAFTDANVQTFGVEVDLPKDEWLARRMATLTSGVTGSKAIPRAALGRAGELRTGYAIGVSGVDGRGLRGRMAILEQRGSASLADDLRAVAAIALQPTACESITGRLLSLTGGDDGFRMRQVRTIGMTGPEGQDTLIGFGAQTPGDIVDKLGELAPAFGLEAEQVRALGAVQDALLAFDPPWVRITATPDAVVPGVTVAYSGQTVEHALRTIGRLATRSDAIATFGSFLEALGNDIVTTIEIIVRPREPLTARLGVAVKV